MPNLGPEPALPGMHVHIGAATTVMLCHRVVLVPGLGQVWHTYRPLHGYVLATIDVTGATRYSWIEDILKFLSHFQLPARNLGLDPRTVSLLDLAMGNDGAVISFWMPNAPLDN